MSYSPMVPPPRPVKTPYPGPRRDRRLIIALIVALVVVSAVVAAIVMPGVVTRAAYSKPPALPQVVAEPPVTEATDLLGKPKLGKPWDASAGPIASDMRAEPFVTPCGVFVTLVEAAAGTPSTASLMQARIVGSDIARGLQLWSIDLREVTGMTEPKFDMFTQVGVTYTADCHMVMNFGETAETNFGRVASVFIDLTSGATQSVTWPLRDDGVCVAAGEHYAGCWARPGQSKGVTTAIDLTATTAPIWTQPANMSYGGDRVVAGLLFTDAGYRDPATGAVVFGADAAASLNGATVEPIQYFEPSFAGGFRSGLIVRLSGLSLNSSLGGNCPLSLWDATTDRAKWTAAEPIACGAGRTQAWGMAGQALIVRIRSLSGDPTTATAYGLSDGARLWQENGDYHLTQWRNSPSVDLNAAGLSQAYVFLAQATSKTAVTLRAIRIADGVETNLALNDHGHSYLLTVAAQGIVYSLDDSSGYSAGAITAYVIDHAHPTAEPRQLWTLALDAKLTGHLTTFAIDGKMYLVRDDRTNGVTVTPLL